MTDVLALLPRFIWRGTEYPITARAVSFAHENATQKLQYRNGELIETTGAHNLTFRYTIPMREDIAKGPYKNLFSKGLVQLLRDIRDRTEAELNDPVYGPFLCVPSSYADNIDINRRDGTDIEVEFVHSPATNEDDTEIGWLTLGALQTDAGALDAEIEKANWEQEPSPEPSTDILGALTGVVAQGLAQADRTSAALDDLAFRMEKLEDTVDRAENPQNWPLKRSARRVREAALRSKDRASDPVKRIKTVTQNFAQTMTGVAAAAGMTVMDFLKLNPSLARAPMVPAGALVRVFQK